MTFWRVTKSFLGMDDPVLMDLVFDMLVRRHANTILAYGWFHTIRVGVKYIHAYMHTDVACHTGRSWGWTPS